MKRVWKRLGHGIYGYADWTIERHDGYPHPGTTWAIYRGRAFVERTYSMTEAKRLVRRRLETPPGFMELAGAGIERLPKPVITYIALKEPKL